MKIFSRIVLGIVLVIGVGFLFLLFWVVRDLEPQYRKVTEEPLADTAYALASLAATTARQGRIDARLFERMFQDARARTFEARIYDFIKRDVDLHVYITDAKGRVIFDSDKGKAVGQDYSQWNDVRFALAGAYGSRTTRMQTADPPVHIMYVAAPVLSGGMTIGVLSVGKPTTHSDLFVSASKRRILLGGLAVLIAVLITSAVVSGMVTHPIKRLTGYALTVKEGKRTMLPDLGSSEIRQLGIAFDEMRDALEGKLYVEQYVQTLTHEIKSPLSAIQGAAELLEEENIQRDRRARFLANIRSESGRIQTLVEKLLLLSTLESRKTRVDAEQLDMNDIVAEVLSAKEPLLETRRIRLDRSSAGDAAFPGERFLVRHAVENIVNNAVEFSPMNGAISVGISAGWDGHVELTVQDSGAGIPSYAVDRIFERFYSLKRPDTGKKSSGLGLSLVQEIMNLHGGTVTVRNSATGGAIATLRFPKAPERS